MRRTGRRLLLMTGVVTALVTAGLAGETSLAVAGAQGTNNRVIVVFKNQEASLPPTRTLDAQRRDAVANVQAPVAAQMRSAGAQNIQSYSVVNAVSATVSPTEESQLQSNPAVSEVIPDQVIQLAPPQSSSGSSAGGAAAPLPGVCSSNPNKPQLNPEALELMNADSDAPGAHTARSLGIDGSGVTVGYIADGLDTNNPDFIRPNGQHVFTDYVDFTGLGTTAPTGGEEAFGDASSIAAQGNQVYNVQNYSSLPLSKPCYIRVEGVAPGASLVGLVAFSGDSGFNSSILEAINYAVNTDHVNVLNESFGSNDYPTDAASLDLIQKADDEAVAAGTVVTVSTGDAGVTSTIGTPATDPNVISAGATTSYRIDMQDGYGGARFPGVTGYLSDNISSFSSAGFDQAGGTVDVVAPGELGWALCTANTTQYSECTSLANNPSPVIAFGGTSESSPMTAGVAALVIQAYRKTHHGNTPTPAVVKQILTSTATDIGAPADQQGSGLLNAYKAVQAAESYKTTPTGDTLLESSSQLNVVAAQGTHRTLTDTITNNGASPETIDVSTRAIGPYSTLKTANVNLSDTTSSHTTDWQGVNNNVQTVTFHVPNGQNRLNAAIAFQNSSASLNARVRLTLVDPEGRLAGYSVPQGDGNYGDIQTTDPAPGTWTAYIYSRDSADGGTTGPVVFRASSATYTSFGNVSPSTLRLSPGQSSPVSMSVTTPQAPGDAAGAIELTQANSGQATTIPVTLRSLVPTGPVTWTNTLTGGNGRGANTGESFYYQINVPGGEPELNASVTLANNPNNSLLAFLVNPSGEAEAYTSNGELTDSSAGLSVTSELGGQLHVLNPAAGTWTLIVVYAPAVSGTAISEPFAVSVNEDSVPVQASAVPDSNHTALTAGKTYTYNLKVRNTGNSPELYFVDPRLSGSTTMNLVSVTNSATQAPLTFSDNFPEYLVPTDSTSFLAQASTDGTEPIVFDTSSPMGDPDLVSNQGLSVSASLNANPITQGEWSVLPTDTGPFGATAPATEDVNTSMSVTAPAFDPAVSTAIGDMWQLSVGGAFIVAPPVAPDASETIPVTITPSGPSGSTVSGTLYVDDEQSYLLGGLAPNGNQVAAVPYQYTIK
jgi:hypothetical protein